MVLFFLVVRCLHAYFHIEDSSTLKEFGQVSTHEEERIIVICAAFEAKKKSLEGRTWIQRSSKLVSKVLCAEHCIVIHLHQILQRWHKLKTAHHNIDVPIASLLGEASERCVSIDRFQGWGIGLNLRSASVSSCSSFAHTVRHSTNSTLQ